MNCGSDVVIRNVLPYLLLEYQCPPKWSTAMPNRKGGDDSEDSFDDDDEDVDSRAVANCLTFECREHCCIQLAQLSTQTVRSSICSPVISGYSPAAVLALFPCNGSEVCSLPAGHEFAQEATTLRFLAVPQQGKQ